MINLERPNFKASRLSIQLTAIFTNQSQNYESHNDESHLVIGGLVALFLVSLPHRESNEFGGSEFVDDDVAKRCLQLLIVL